MLFFAEVDFTVLKNTVIVDADALELLDCRLDNEKPCNDASYVKDIVTLNVD